ncbi:hypothetical protein H1S01_09010 [Heliobacterium chlorum]|uniref:Phage holin n=1 Tax=Heliobacterium chlorum TaxID=2698 RepID=A0ABR7T1I6_HELCL|nr:phage holin, LLH family [Heliobacterium chlorum]MBC9784649.1 hypothetical protein [Heliobacterium chlorum]
MNVDLLLIGLYVIVFGVIVVTTYLTRNFGPAAMDYMRTVTTEQERQTVGNLALSAVVYARNRYGHLSGDEQFEMALKHLGKTLENKEIVRTIEEMKSAIEFAYEEAKKKGLIASLKESVQKTS